MAAASPLVRTRPLGLVSGFFFAKLKAALAWLLFAAAVGAFFLFVVWDLPEVINDGRHYDAWTETTQVEVDGERRSKPFLGWLVAFYDLEVRYLTGDGTDYRGASSFATALGGPDTDAAPIVRYDPADPSRFILSWTRSANGARYRFIVILGLIVGFVAIICFILPLEPMREYWRTRVCGQSGEEITVKMTGKTALMNSGKPTGKIRYTFKVADGVERTSILGSDEKPLYLSADETTALALRSPRWPEHPVLLRRDLYPFKLSAAEREAIASKLGVS